MALRNQPEFLTLNIKLKLEKKKYIKWFETWNGKSYSITFYNVYSGFIDMWKTEKN